MCVVSTVKDAAAVPSPPPVGATTFLLGTIGVVVAQRFADRIAPLDLRPNHSGLLRLLASGGAPAQLDIARTMGVAPSLIVRLVDHLEQMSAIARVRDPGDRRRQTLELTEFGRVLLGQCEQIARELDAEVFAGLTDAEREGLRAVLHQVAGDLGLVTG